MNRTKATIYSQELIRSKAKELALTETQTDTAMAYVAALLAGQKVYAPSNRKSREVGHYVFVRTCLDLQIKNGTLPAQSEGWYKQLARTIDAENKQRRLRKS